MSYYELVVKHPYKWVGGFAAAAFAATFWIHAPTIVVAAGFAPFAVVYIVAQALERFLEPLSNSAMTTAVKAGAENEVVDKALALKEAPAGQAPAKAKEVKAAEGTVSAAERERAVYFWVVASVLGLAISAILGLGLIQSVALVNGGHPSHFFRAVDVVVTGLAIGAGTKPLHDLIGVIQETKKEKKTSAAAELV